MLRGRTDAAPSCAPDNTRRTQAQSVSQKAGTSAPAAGAQAQSLRQETATPRPRTARQRTGDAGEDAAALFLQQAGFRVLARNWRQGRLELDIVCREGDVLVFVEVKTRAAGGMLLPGEAVTPRKRATLFRAARAWLAAHDDWDAPCRFDVVCVTRRADTFTVEHIPHAFDISPFVDGGHTAWQPW